MVQNFPPYDGNHSKGCAVSGEDCGVTHGIVTIINQGWRCLNTSSFTLSFWS